MAASQPNYKVTAKVDFPKLFECPVCFKFMDGNIFQCESGHPVCGDCKLKNKCPSCEKPFLAVRNLPLEYIAEHVSRPCNIGDCREMTTTAQKNEHMLECKHREIQCPSCEWNGSIRKFADHIKNANHVGYSDIFDFDRAINMDVHVAVRNQWKSWYRIDDNKNVFQLRVFVSDTGYSWFCCRLFGTKSEASKYRFKFEMKSVESKDRNSTVAKGPSSTIFQQGSIYEDVHSDLENGDGNCVPLFNYDGLLKLGVINKDNKLQYYCIIFRKGDGSNQKWSKC